MMQAECKSAANSLSDFQTLWDRPNLFKSDKLIAIIEEHGLIGGVGSSVLEWANENKFDTKKVLRFGGPDKFLTGCGNQIEARKFIGLTSKKIFGRILKILKK